MQFKHPEILYALLLLIIPIIVHLFQLRRFEKIAFTNVAFLKKIDLQTRKSSKLKKFLILLSRLLLFASIILAFAQPYFSQVAKNAEQHTYIYLDNSFSMQANGSQGELLKRAAQDIIEQTKHLTNINLITNNNQWYDLSFQEMKQELLNLSYFPIKQNLKSILSKIKSKNSLNDIVLISDFQSINNSNNIILDSLSNYNFIQLKPKKESNISLDSIYISNQNSENITLNVIVKSFNEQVNKVPVSLSLDNIIMGKSNVDIEKNGQVEVDFTIPLNDGVNGKVSITDDNLVFDNDLYFTINNADKINVLAIGENTNYLSKIYTTDEFNFKSNTFNEVDFSTFTNQNLLILNELENIPQSLISSLTEAVKNGSNLVVIPNINSSISSYNKLFNRLNIGSIISRTENKIAITDINFANPFLQNVFEKKIKNFQYPTVNSYFNSTLRNSSSILKFENENTFVAQIKTKNSIIYWLASAINRENSNFKNSPLIVPVFYNFGKYSYQNLALNYTIGQKNEIEIKASLQKDNILQISNTEESFIPLQQIGSNSVKIITNNQPIKNGIYSVSIKDENLQNIAFNYNKEESNLNYVNIKNIFKNNSNSKYYTSVKQAFTTINSKYKTSSFWQLFLILAIVFLTTEILLLKFLKP